MKRGATIQQSIASFLMLVLTISMAPRAYFHDMVADHEDSPGCHQLHESAVLHQHEVHCHFDDLVVSAPFISATEQPVTDIIPAFEKKHSFLYSSPQKSFYQHKENRGPPFA